MSVTADTRAVLRDRAASVLHGNDEGSWTKASPVLYPHQWSWDSASLPSDGRTWTSGGP